jgi:hypothetical protein
MSNPNSHVLFASGKEDACLPAVTSCSSTPKVKGVLQRFHARGPDGKVIGFDDAREREDLGWLLENTIWINRAHPAYRKAASTGNESYHVVLGVVWVLLGHLDDRHSAQEFIGQFLSGWGRRVEGGR